MNCPRMRYRCPATRPETTWLIVGSVAPLFNTGFFVGPNRAQKVNRARLTPDGVTVSGGFEAIRVQMAEARAPKVAVPSATPDVQVASIDPDVTGSIGDASAALAAIDQVVPMPSSMCSSGKCSSCALCSATSSTRAAICTVPARLPVGANRTVRSTG